MARRRRISYELVTCALSGHALVGLEASTVGPQDALVVRESDGVRWHRCLRCDGWFPRPVPSAPGGGPVPGRDEIEIPRRGPALRDRYVLRLIALDRAIHVVVLTALAFAIFFLIGHHHTLQRDYDRIMNDLYGGSSGGAGHGLLAHFHHVFLISTSHLYLVALVVLAYACLEAIEMVGLWFALRWAEYLTFVATIVFVPFEIYELTRSVSVLKALTLVINLAIALYLLLAKRLFGLRGGHAALEARRQAGGGWAALERADAGLPLPVQAGGSE